MVYQPTFFFYDLETSGLNPKTQRIMQFAGQRTDSDLKPVGKPINVLVRLTEDVLPDPQAIMITGITPQKTLEEGFSEAEFMRMLNDQVFTSNTTVVGFNNIRFDDEFMRYALYRNFYDPYEWAWADGRSRWDILDVVRMTRALRPEGINWPTDENGRATNRLELLTKANNLDHEHAHDALNDVLALIAVTQLIRDKQPKLFDYLLQTRGKHAVNQVLDTGQPFVYASGRYPSDVLHTTAAIKIAPSDKPGSVVVWDLRHDPTDWADKPVDDLKKIRFANWEQRQMEGFVSLPAKELNITRCPAIAPLGVLDDDAQQRIKLDLPTIQANLKKLRGLPVLFDTLKEVFSGGDWPKGGDVDGQLYNGFLNDKDKNTVRAVRSATEKDLADFHPIFADERLEPLLLRYKARNYPTILSEDERVMWEQFRAERLQQELPKFMQTIARLAPTADENKQFLLQELQLWAESIAPIPD